MNVLANIVPHIDPVGEMGAGLHADSRNLVLIRTVCRHPLAKVLACPRAAAWGGRTGENCNGQSPE